MPDAQLTLATRMITMPIPGEPPVPPCPAAACPVLPPNGPARNPTPITPATSPARASRPIRAPLTTRSMMISHSGTVATSKAASPEGTLRSPADTPPFPPGQQQGADEERRPPARGPGPVGGAQLRTAGPDREREHEQPGHDVADARHQQRRQSLHAHPDGEVRAAPQHPDHQQREPSDLPDAAPSPPGPPRPARVRSSLACPRPGRAGSSPLPVLPSPPAR